MRSPAPQPSILLLERTEIDNQANPDQEILHPRPDPDAPATVAPSGATSPSTMFRAPGLAVLAAVSVLEGYRWFGVITNGGSRPWAVVFAVVAVIGGFLLTRNNGGRPRDSTQRLVVLAAVVVALATVVVVGRGEEWATVTVGIADLALASAALVALAAGERSRHRNDVAA